LQETRDRYAKEYGYNSYADIPVTAISNGYKVKDLINNKPDVVLLTKNIAETNERRGYTEGIRYQDFKDELDNAKATMIATFVNAENSYKAGLSTGSDYRETVKLAKYAYGIQLDDIYKRYSDVVSTFKSSTKTTADVAYTQLMAAYNIDNLKIANAHGI
jgi:hypothetical protein